MTEILDRNPLIIAHRGAHSGDIPENTELAFWEAVQHGVVCLEYDLWLSGQTPVIIHDRDVSRTTNGTGFIDQLSIEEIKALDAGNGESVPFLADVLRSYPSILHNLEIKDDNPSIVTCILDQLKKTPAPVLISSFESSILKFLRQCDTEVPIGVLVKDSVDAALMLAQEIRAYSLHLPLRLCLEQPFQLKRLSDRGYKVYVFTVNDIDQAKWLIEKGAHGLFSDCPHLIQAGL